MAEHVRRHTYDDNGSMVDDGIKVGDRVALRSGGPVMTVQARSQNLVYCAWTSDGRLFQGTFDVGSLSPCAPPQALDGEDRRPCA
jgi:uncharacterized protein YodC (DUF2158 family)